MNQGINLFNESIYEALIKNKKYLLNHPSYLVAFAKIIRNIKQQNEKRDMLSITECLTVPPILIMSVTTYVCNLSCAGCYACAQSRKKESELSTHQIAKITDEAIELGVSIILIAGGEPLLKEGIIDIPKKHETTPFILFTNGLMIDENTINDFRTHKNIIPVMSLEGGKYETDARRGDGMYDKICSTMEHLKQNDIMFGSSITLTSENYSTVMADRYLKSLEECGCGLAFLIEYVPQTEDDALTLTPDQKNDLIKKEKELTEKLNMIVIALPGDEEKYGGCLAAGRGFIHVSSEGNLEACPFAPYSDTNLKDLPLKEALKSKLIKDIRDNHHLLTESRGGCALNENKAWIESLMTK